MILVVLCVCSAGSEDGCGDVESALDAVDGSVDVVLVPSEDSATG